MRTPLLLTAALAGALVAALAGAAGASSEAGRVVRIAATGDIAMVAAPDGGAGLFARARRYLTGDVVLGNLEGTLATGGASKCSASSRDCFSFRAPPSYARLLERAGFTIMNLANNHAFDYGPTGQAETVAALDRAGLRHTGRPAEIAYAHAGPMRIAVIGFAPYPWAQDLLDLPGARRIVRRADRRADLVVVTMHAGAEGRRHGHMQRGTEFFLGENRGDPIAFAHAVVDAGADLVVGHGPHVLRAMEWYRGRLIAYSLGNFLGNGTLNVSGVSGVSAILKVRLRPDGSWAGGTIAPIRLTPDGLPAPDRSGAAKRVVRDLSREDFGRRGTRVSSAGALLPPR